MLKAIVIDDEVHCAERLCYLLTLHCSGSVHVCGSFGNVTEGLTAIEQLHPDVLFLDVELNGETGFDLLRQCKSKELDVIFTTAYDQYAVQAFRFSALDYLLKPVDADELKDAVGKIQKRSSQGQMTKRFDTLFHNMGQLAGHQKRIVVHTIQGLEFLQLNDIVRLESSANYTTIILKDKQKIVVAKTLKEFEELLSDYDFYRIHNSHLVNLNYIKSYKRGKGGLVVLLDRSEIEVSSRRKEEFLRRLSEL